jgi:leucyl-tRNA synthetase
VLYDEGLVTVKEPFARLENQGQVLALTPYRKPKEGETLGIGEDGVLVSFQEAENLPKEEVAWRWARMSKSKGNVVTPDEMVEQFGADALRIYLLFVAPFNADVEWDSAGVNAAAKFLSRVFRFVDEHKEVYADNWRDLIAFEELDDRAKAIRRATHKAIRDVTKDIEEFGFNTYVSWLMKYLNALGDSMSGAAETSRPMALSLSEAVETIILLLSPAAPHSADELWESLGKKGFTYQADWPKFDAKLAEDDLVTVAVQVNGKLRDTIQASAKATNDELEALAKASEKVLAHLDGLAIRKVIVVPGKLVNIVAT